MNKNCIDSMRKQMVPSPESRAALLKKLAQVPQRRKVPLRRYAALAACAALAVGILPLYHAIFNHNDIAIAKKEILQSETQGPFHSYVMADNTQYIAENATETGAGAEDKYTSLLGTRDSGANPLPAPNTGDLPGGAYVGDAPVQEEAADAYQKLMDRFSGEYPDWYGGAYTDDNDTLVVCLVGAQDPGDKSLEMQVLNWTDNGRVSFTDVKYSLSHLTKLMDELNRLPDADMKYGDVMAGWGINEEANCIELTLTQVYDPLLSVLARLDPDDDAICVQIGQRAVRDEAVCTDSAKTEEPSVYHVLPGVVSAPGTVIDEGKDVIAEEPVYDGAHYDLKQLPEELPEDKRPATQVSPGRDSCYAPED